VPCGIWSEATQHKKRPEAGYDEIFPSKHFPAGAKVR